MEPRPQNAPIRQHYLPTVYLKHFSEDGSAATRKSFVHRIDSKRCIRATVESQGYAEGYYSRRAPLQAENLFKDLEGQYGSLVQKVWRGENSEFLDYFSLIVMVFDLHLRGIGYENATRESNAMAYQRRLRSFLDQVLIADGRHGHSDEEILAHLKAHWRLRLLASPGSSGLITSDWPALWFMLAADSNVKIAMLPVTPGIYAVAYDRRFISVEGNELSETDCAVLNRHQMYHCIESVYCSGTPTNEEVAKLQAILSERNTSRGKDDGVSWEMNLLTLPEGKPFSFLSVQSDSARSEIDKLVPVAEISPAMAVTYVKQQDPRCCILACLSSLLSDKYRPLSQQQLIDKYPLETNKGKFFDAPANSQPKDGAMAPHQLFRLLEAEGLARHFAVGSGKDFLRRHTKRVPDGIFLLTTTGANGQGELYHCLRVENVTEPNAVFVMEPALGYPNQFRPIGWNDAEFLKSIVVVCIT